MPAPHRVRLADGSVIDLPVADLRSWYESGLVTADTQVQPPHSRDWVRLGQAMDVRGWKKPAAPRGVSVPATPAGKKKTTPAPRAASAPRPAGARAAAEPSALAALPLARYARIAGGVAAVFTILYFAAPYVVPLVFGTAEQRRVKAATTSERTFTDGSVGLTLAVPDGWRLLRRDHDLFTSPAHTRATLVDPGADAYAALVVETPPRGYASLDAWLDRVVDDRRREEPALAPGPREDAPGQARRVAGRRVAGGTAYDETITAWQDGWTYYALVAWAPEGGAAAATDAIRNGISVRGDLSGRLRAAIATVTAEVPILTARAAETLMGRSQAQVLEPAEAFRRAYLLAGRGIQALDRNEQAEMGRISSELYGRLGASDRARLGAYLERVRAGRETDPAQDAAMGKLVKGAFARLPAARQKRLQALFEKAIGSAADTSFGG